MSLPTVGKFTKKYYQAYLPSFAAGTIASVPVHARGRIVDIQAAPIGAMSVNNAVVSFTINGNAVSGLSTATTPTTATTGGSLWDVEPSSPFAVTVNRNDTMDVTVITSGTTTTAIVSWTVVEY